MVLYTRVQIFCVTRDVLYKDANVFLIFITNLATSMKIIITFSFTIVNQGSNIIMGVDMSVWGLKCPSACFTIY